MLVVKTRLMLSEVGDGLGLFASKDIKSGDVVWKSTLTECLPMIYDLKTKAQFEEQGYRCRATASFVILKDDTLYLQSALNDSETNILPRENGDLIACRDILEGEEILSWYEDYMYYNDALKFMYIDRSPEKEVQRVRNRAILIQ